MGSPVFEANRYNVVHKKMFTRAYSFETELRSIGDFILNEYFVTVLFVASNYRSPIVDLLKIARLGSVRRRQRSCYCVAPPLDELLPLVELPEGEPLLEPLPMAPAD
jgi:hypothetical protein